MRTVSYKTVKTLKKYVIPVSSLSPMQSNIICFIMRENAVEAAQMAVGCC